MQMSDSHAVGPTLSPEENRCFNLSNILHHSLLSKLLSISRSKQCRASLLSKSALVLSRKANMNSALSLLVMPNFLCSGAYLNFRYMHLQIVCSSETGFVCTIFTVQITASPDLFYQKQWLWYSWYTWLGA